MKTGVGIDPGLRLSRPQQRELVQEAARIGYQSLWMPAGVTGRSVFQTSAEWWEASTAIVSGGLSLGISVIPFPGWTVPTLAAMAATTSEVLDGKFNLGIGLGAFPGEAFRYGLGLPLVSPLALTRDYLITLRGLFAGQTVDYTGRGVSLHGLSLAAPVIAPPVPVYLAAMGPQMLRLAGELSDGVTPNWSSPEEIARMRPHVAEGARKAGRDASEIPFAQYIRVCVDEDEDAARRQFATNMLGYAMARPGQPKDKGYRAHFGRMGFEEVLSDLEARRDAGTPLSELVDLVPPNLLLRVGYFGKPSGAAAAFKRLAQGLDEAMVRLITVRPGDLGACVTAMRACWSDT